MDYLIHIAILFCIYSMLTLSLNVLVGYTGLVSVAHAAFYGVGAYTLALLTRAGWDFFPALGAGMLLAAALAALVGIVMSRFKNDYYVLGGIGITVITYGTLLNWTELTRGPLGLPGIARPELFGYVLSSNLDFLLFILVLLLLTFLVIRIVVLSPFGRVLKAIRDDQQAITVFGYPVFWYKLFVFVGTASVAGLAGGLMASYLSYIDPTLFTVNESAVMLTMVILGGLASLSGSLLGAAILVLIPEGMRFLGLPIEIVGQARLGLYSLLLVLLMMFLPKGLKGEFKL